MKVKNIYIYLGGGGRSGGHDRCAQKSYFFLKIPKKWGEGRGRVGGLGSGWM